MKRRFANEVEGEYFQERIEDDYFKDTLVLLK